MRHLAALPMLLLGTPLVAAAQSTTVASYVAADGAVSGMPVLVGLTVGREVSHGGIRWSTGVDARTTFSGSEATSADGFAGLFTTEVEGLVFPLGTRSDARFNPYAFAGAGLRLTRDAVESSPAALWSYGVGARSPISPRLALEAEMRNRRPMMGDAASMPMGTAPGWEMRAGVSLRIGRTVAMTPRATMPGRLDPRARSGPLGVGVASTATSSSAAAAVIAMRAIDTADDYLGVRYLWGGNTPGEGFDCSGFVKYVFSSQGISLPRVSRDQARAGVAVPLELSQFQPGDLLAFASDGRTIDHIAIYAGNNRIIHSSASGGGVRYDDLTAGRGDWYLRHMVSATRVID